MKQKRSTGRASRSPERPIMEPVYPMDERLFSDEGLWRSMVAKIGLVVDALSQTETSPDWSPLAATAEHLLSFGEAMEATATYLEKLDTNATRRDRLWLALAAEGLPPRTFASPQLATELRQLGYLADNVVLQVRAAAEEHSAAIVFDPDQHQTNVLHVAHALQELADAAQPLWDRHVETVVAANGKISKADTQLAKEIGLDL